MERFLARSSSTSDMGRPNTGSHGDDVEDLTSNETISTTTNMLIAIPSTDPAEETSSSCRPRPTSNTTAQQSNVIDGNPWPYLHEFFVFIGKKSDGKYLEFQCVLCHPLERSFSTSIGSANNLKKHVERQHSHKLPQYNQCLKDARQNRKRVAYYTGKY